MLPRFLLYPLTLCDLLDAIYGKTEPHVGRTRSTQAGDHNDYVRAQRKGDGSTLKERHVGRTGESDFGRGQYTVRSVNMDERQY
jgi:hypothetical protein